MQLAQSESHHFAFVTRRNEGCWLQCCIQRADAAQCLIQPIRVIRLYCFDACASKAEFGQYWLRELNCLFQPGNVVSRFCPSE
jgi:hypothetical protein